MNSSIQTNFRLSIALACVLTACSSPDHPPGDYPIRPVDFTQVHLSDNFWAPRILRNHEITIPIAFHQSEITGRIKNFEVAGGLSKGSFCSQYAFDDSDVFKIIEGASYSLQTIPDPKLESYLDSLIFKIGAAQEADGYLYTNRTIMGDSALPMAGPTRWSRVEESSHELYNVGHLYEAAVAFYQATGKKSLLDIALRNANLIDSVFGWDKLVKAPGHQEIEIGLIKLYRITGDEKYLNLARFFLEARGPDGHPQLQMHQKVLDQTEAVGHAVRAGYMFSAMADIAAITGDSIYAAAVDKIWEDIACKKTYITGGIGTERGNEGFDRPYVLPNLTAYCETCASIALTFLNQRLFSLSGKAKYYDLLEKTLYNALISGVSLSGDRFFYPNPLESEGQHQRSEWFGCACCPSNIARFIPAVPGYVYSQTDEAIYVNLFIANTAQIEMRGTNVEIIQKTDYPWNGEVSLIINPKKDLAFCLKIRKPGWTQNEAMPGGLYQFRNPSHSSVSLKVNNENLNYDTMDGYILINRKWRKGDQLILDFPMEVREVVADEKIEEDWGKVAFQRGPIIFCAEWPETATGRVLNQVIPSNAVVSSQFIPEWLGGTQVVDVEGLRLIPYHLWNNRGSGEMEVWMKLGD